jgi:hypothetical protein
LQLSIQELFGIALGGSSMGSARSDHSMGSHTSGTSISNVSNTASSSREDNKIIIKWYVFKEEQTLHRTLTSQPAILACFVRLAS